MSNNSVLKIDIYRVKSKSKTLKVVGASFAAENLSEVEAVFEMFPRLSRISKALLNTPLIHIAGHKNNVKAIANATATNYKLKEQQSNFRPKLSGGC